MVLNHENRTVNIDPNEFSHICNPDRNEIMRKKGRAAILNLMMENDNHDYQTVVGRVLRQLTYDIGFAETMQFTPPLTLRRTFNRQAAEALGQPPKKFSDLVFIPQSLTNTKLNERFCISAEVYFENEINRGPIIIFAN